MYMTSFLSEGVTTAFVTESIRAAKELLSALGSMNSHLECIVRVTASTCVPAGTAFFAGDADSRLFNEFVNNLDNNI